MVDRKLVAALEPFARAAEAIDENERDHYIYQPELESTAPHITVGDLRNAAAALKSRLSAREKED